MNATALRAALTVAAVYGHFLIFAQFALVELLRAGGLTGNREKSALAAMAVAGIAGGFLMARAGAPRRALQAALALAGVVAWFSPWCHGLPAGLAAATLTGATLGVATVGLASSLPGWCGPAWVGIGTGLAYAACNLPAVFLQSPATQAGIGGVFALVGAVVLPRDANHAMAPSAAIAGPGTSRSPWWAVVAMFTALVWMDSAAFFIIQHAPVLKSHTWGAELLWRNSAVHAVFAAAAGWCLMRGLGRSLPAVAFAILAIAALAVNDAGTRSLASWLYSAAVSIYSVALVVWPGWFAGATDRSSRAWRAAWLFAIAGWFGSANGIGMAQSLHRVPPLFVAIATCVMIGAFLLSRPRPGPSLAAVGMVLGIAAAGSLVPPRTKEKAPPLSAAQRGHAVYLAEGCIHCHSRYPRPGSADETPWGPSPAPDELRAQRPVLIGNRRQGPDLANVGSRRSEAWLKLHFIDPRALVPDSTMPSYAHLFDDQRGDDLVRFLKESGVSHTMERMRTAAAWPPSPPANPAATPVKPKPDAKALFARHCAACHGPEGTGNGPLARQFIRPPANLRDGPFLWSRIADESTPLPIARIVKFGIPGTDMPGHETLPDADIHALATEVLRLRSGR